MIKPLRLVAAVLLICGLAVGSLHAYDRYELAALNEASKSRADQLIDGALVAVESSSIVFSPATGPSRDSVILLHAWGVPDPAAYTGLIEHLLKGGRTVHFPLYQRTFFPHSIADKVATILDADAPGWRKESHLLIGHSAGATGGLDLALSELQASRIEDVILLSPGDGTGPDGKPAATSVKMLEWGQTHFVFDRKQTLPRFHIFVSKDDHIVGDFTALRIAEYLAARVPGAPTRVYRLPEDVAGCANHFWPLGGYEAFELAQGTQWFARVDPKGGCGDWTIDRADRFLWDFINEDVLAASRNSGDRS